jgi:hypothetical protein
MVAQKIRIIFCLTDWVYHTFMKSANAAQKLCAHARYAQLMEIDELDERDVKY